MPSKQVLIGLAAVYLIFAWGFYYLGTSFADGAPDDESRDGVVAGGATGGSNSTRGGRNSNKGTRSFRLDDLKQAGRDLQELDANSLNTLMMEMEAAFDAGVQDQAAVGRVWNMIQHLGEKDLDAALDYAANVPPPKGQFIALLLLPRLGTFRGADAMEKVKEVIPGGQMQMMGNMMVLMSWSEAKPADAFDWYLESKNSSQANSLLQGSMFRSMIMGSLFTNLAREDVGAAFTRIGQLNDQQLEQEAVTSLAYLGSQPDIRDRLIPEFFEIENAEVRSAALSQLAGSWATSDPRAALEWAQNLEDTHDRESAYAVASDAWIESDPETAANELLQSTEEEDRGAFFQRVAGSWVQRDQEAALTWLSANAEGEDRDTALARGADAIAYTSPEGALSWANEIESEEVRTRTAVTAFDVIEERSGQEAAEAALRSSGFADETIRTIMEASEEAASSETLEGTRTSRIFEHEADSVELTERELPQEP